MGPREGKYNRMGRRSRLTRKPAEEAGPPMVEALAKLEGPKASVLPLRTNKHQQGSATSDEVAKQRVGEERTWRWPIACPFGGAASGCKGRRAYR